MDGRCLTDAEHEAELAAAREPAAPPYTFGAALQAAGFGEPNVSAAWGAPRLPGEGRRLSDVSEFIASERR